MVDSQMLPRHGAHAAGVELCYGRGRRDAATGGQGRDGWGVEARKARRSSSRATPWDHACEGEGGVDAAGRGCDDALGRATGGDAAAGALPGGRRGDGCLRSRALEGARCGRWCRALGRTVCAAALTRWSCAQMQSPHKPSRFADSRNGRRARTSAPACAPPVPLGGLASRPRETSPTPRRIALATCRAGHSGASPPARHGDRPSTGLLDPRSAHRPHHTPSQHLNHMTAPTASIRRRLGSVPHSSPTRRACGR
jgi:hypothetical protein